MLTLFRGGPTVWINNDDAAANDIQDNDWLEVYNRNGVVTARAVVSHRMPKGTMYMYHAQDKHINVPGSEITKDRGGSHNAPTRIHVKPTQMVGAMPSSAMVLTTTDRSATSGMCTWLSAK